MPNSGVRVVHVCATLGTGVARRAGAIHRAISRSVSVRGIKIREYTVITGVSQGGLVRGVGTRVLPILPDRDERIGSNREWTTDVYRADFERYETALRQVLASERELFRAELCISDQVPEVLDPTWLPPAPCSIFINDYFQEIGALGTRRHYIPQVLASNAQILFMDTELLLRSTAQLNVAQQFGMRFHVAGPVIDQRAWDSAGRLAARARLDVDPEALVAAIAHAPTPNLRSLLQSFADARPLVLLVADIGTATWLRQVSPPAVRVITVHEWRGALLASDIMFGKGGRVVTYEALWHGVAPICDPYPDNEKEAIFARVLADHGIVASAATGHELLDDGKRGTLLDAGRSFRERYLHAGQLHVAIDALLDQLSLT